MDKIRKEKEAAEYQECTFQPKLASDMRKEAGSRSGSKSPVKNPKAQKLLKRRQRQNGGAASPAMGANASEYAPVPDERARLDAMVHGGGAGSGEENMQSAGNEQDYAGQEYYPQSPAYGAQPGPAAGNGMDLMALAEAPMPGDEGFQPPPPPPPPPPAPAPAPNVGYDANEYDAAPPQTSPAVQKGWSQETVVDGQGVATANGRSGSQGGGESYVDKKLEMLRADVSGRGQGGYRQGQGTGGAFPLVDEQASNAANGSAEASGIGAAEKLAEVEDILREEKQQWVLRLKKENSTLVGVLADVRAAKKKLLTEYEKLDIERNKFYAVQAETQDSELAELLASLPLGSRSLAATKGKEALSLHGLITKLILAQRAHQKVTMDKLLKGAAVIEQAYMSNPGNTEAIKTGLNQIRDVVTYSNLGDFFDNQWGQSDASDILERRGIALSSVVPVGYEQAGDDGLGGGEAGAPVVAGEIHDHPHVKKIMAKTAALKNNLSMLRNKNKKAKTAVGAIGAAAVFREEGTKAKARRTATQMEAMGLSKNPEQPKFAAVPPEWQYVSTRCLKDAARATLLAEPRAEGMPEPLMVELIDFIADEVKDAFAPMLLPVAKAQTGEFEEGQAVAQVSLIIAAPAMQVEIAPVAMMALTYMQSRADMH